VAFNSGQRSLIDALPSVNRRGNTRTSRQAGCASRRPRRQRASAPFVPPPKCGCLFVCRGRVVERPHAHVRIVMRKWSGFTFAGSSLSAKEPGADVMKQRKRVVRIVGAQYRFVWARNW